MDFVEQLKSSVDIVKVIGEYVPRLKRVGATGRYMALCPFHTEKTPSFSVYAPKQLYKCFGCGVGGDVLKFVQEIEGISFYEALKLLAERYGIPMPKRAEYSDADSKLRGALFEIHEIAARQFQANLKSPAGADARAYLARRGVTPAEIEQFGLGYSDPSGHGLLRRLEQEHYTHDVLTESGLVLKRQDGSGFFDRFRGRLMFPIHNESGKIIGFGGRALREGDDPKYLNSPETKLYYKTQVLYNLHRAKNAIRKLEHVVLVEGYMDVIGVFSAGVQEVVASCGTSLTNIQVRALKRHTGTIVVNFDPDTAGANASERSIQLLLEEGMHVRILELDGGLDPDEYVKQNGADAYRAKLNSAGSYFHWLADRARKRFDMKTAEGRMAGFQFLMPAIQRISDKLERAAIVNDLASFLGVEAGLVLEQFRKSAVDRRSSPLRQPRRVVAAVERILLGSLLESEEARQQVLPELRTKKAVESFVTRSIFETLFQMHASGAPIDFAHLEARLDEGGKSLLHELLLADETGEEAFSPEQALACLRRLETTDRESRRADLRARVKAAEREGKFDEALQWMTELNRLEKSETG